MDRAIGTFSKGVHTLNTDDSTEEKKNLVHMYYKSLIYNCVYKRPSRGGHPDPGTVPPVVPLF